MPVCESISCGAMAQPEHTPCCSTHGRDLCCKHYCRAHFVEVNPCSSADHAAVTP